MADFDYLGEGTLKRAADKMSVLRVLHEIARAYRNEGFPEETIIRPIILKKITFIKAAESQSQLSEILQPTRVRYFGGEVHPVGLLAIPEEELTIWPRVNVKAGEPLITPAAKRYETLFRLIFPEIAKETDIWMKDDYVRHLTTAERHNPLQRIHSTNRTAFKDPFAVT